MNKGVMAIIGIVVLVVGVGLFGYNVSVDNRAVMLGNKFDKQLGLVEGFHDTMWKTIKQQANVTDKAKDAFKEIYTPLIEGRYSQGDGTLMKWVKEHNPEFGTEMYQKLMVSIESLRKQFFHVQSQVLATIQEHDNLRERFPSKVFCNAEPLEYEVISSTRSKQVMKDGKDDDVSL